MKQSTTMMQDVSSCHNLPPSCIHGPVPLTEPHSQHFSGIAPVPLLCASLWKGCCRPNAHAYSCRAMLSLPAKSRINGSFHQRFKTPDKLLTKVLRMGTSRPHCTKHPNVEMSLQVEPATATRRTWLPRPWGSALRWGCAPSLVLPSSKPSCLALPRREWSKGPYVTNHTLHSHLWKELGGLKFTCAIFNGLVTCALNWPLFTLLLSVHLPSLPRIPLAISNFQVLALPSPLPWPWPFVSCQHLLPSIHRHQEPCGCSKEHSSRTHCCPGSWLRRQWKTLAAMPSRMKQHIHSLKIPKKNMQVLLVTMTACSQVQSPVQHLEPCFLAQEVNVLLKQLVSIHLFHQWLLFDIHPTSNLTDVKARSWSQVGETTVNFVNGESRRQFRI